MTSVQSSGLSQAIADGLYDSIDDMQNSTPTAGQTVLMNDTSKNGTLVLSPAATLATLTVTLPTNANSRIGQIRRIATTKAITILTVNGAGSLFGVPAALILGDCIEFQKTAADTWMRII